MFTYLGFTSQQLMNAIDAKNANSEVQHCRSEKLHKTRHHRPKDIITKHIIVKFTRAAKALDELISGVHRLTKLFDELSSSSFPLYLSITAVEFISPLKLSIFKNQFIIERP